jgi:hypothetical protein
MVTVAKKSGLSIQTIQAVEFGLQNQIRHSDPTEVVKFLTNEINRISVTYGGGQNVPTEICKEIIEILVLSYGNFGLMEIGKAWRLAAVEPDKDLVNLYGAMNVERFIKIIKWYAVFRNKITALLTARSNEITNTIQVQASAIKLRREANEVTKNEIKGAIDTCKFLEDWFLVPFWWFSWLWRNDLLRFGEVTKIELLEQSKIFLPEKLSEKLRSFDKNDRKEAAFKMIEINKMSGEGMLDIAHNAKKLAVWHFMYNVDFYDLEPLNITKRVLFIQPKI